MIIILELLEKYWRPLIVTLLLFVIYGLIFKEGVTHCEDQEKIAAAKATQQEQVKSRQQQDQLNNKVVTLAQNLTKEQTHSKDIEGKLNAEIHKPSKKIYSQCIVPVSGVRLFNAACQ